MPLASCEKLYCMPAIFPCFVISSALEFTKHRSISTTKWTCRASKNNDEQKRSRGRSVKRKVLYDAMKTYECHFEPLLGEELMAEQERAKVIRFSTAGNSFKLRNLSIYRAKRLFCDIVYSLRSSTILQPLRFRKGNLVDIIYKSEITQAVILARRQKELLVTVAIGSEADNRMVSYAEYNFRVDVEPGVNTKGYERAKTALDFFTKNQPPASDIARLILVSFAESPKHLFTDLPKKLLNLNRSGMSHSLTNSAWSMLANEKVSMLLEGDVNNILRKLPSYLNQSQLRAIKRALYRRMTLIQGPPGTGKTLVAAHLISCILQLSKGPILACAGTNIATDNLMRNVLSCNPDAKVIRLGRISAVDEDMWNNSLDSLLERNRQVRKARLDLAQGISRSVKDLEQKVTHKLLKRADVIIATCVGCGREELEELAFSYIIIDEASQITEPDSLIPIACSQDIVPQIALIGDHCQLPPTALSARSKVGYDLSLDISMFFRLLMSGMEAQLLDVQYRMHPHISHFPSTYFYSGKIRDGVQPEQRSLPSNLSNEASSLFLNCRSLFCNVEDGIEESASGSPTQNNRGTSFVNRAEAGIVVKIIQLLKANSENCGAGGRLVFEEQEIGVISPYEGQVRILQDLLVNRGKYKDIKVSTVDGFQGQEKDVIIVSTVRSNNEGSVGFLRDWRRLNVSITRSRRLLVVVGNSITLSNNCHWKSWIAAQARINIRTDEHVVWIPDELGCTNSASLEESDTDEIISRSRG